MQGMQVFWVCRGRAVLTCCRSSQDSVEPSSVQTNAGVSCTPLGGVRVAYTLVQHALRSDQQVHRDSSSSGMLHVYVQFCCHYDVACSVGDLCYPQGLQTNSVRALPGKECGL